MSQIWTGLKTNKSPLAFSVLVLGYEANTHHKNYLLRIKMNDILDSKIEI